MIKQAQKYGFLHSLPKNAIDTLSEIEDNIEFFTRKISKLKFSVKVLERELKIIEDQLDEFLMLYYERVSDQCLDKGLAGSGASVGAFDFDNIEFERQSITSSYKEAHGKELKKLYRELVKELHPDSVSNKFERESFNRLNEIYKNGDLEEMVFFKAKLDNRKKDFNNINFVKLIEDLEMEEKYLSRKYEKLLQEKHKVQSAPEYKLFCRYRLAEVRGDDFFDQIAQSFQ